MTSSKIELKKISILRIFLACIILIPLLSIVSISVIYDHLSSIDQNIFSLCTDKDSFKFQNCANQTLYNYFADSQWIARQFILYQFISLFITMIACYKKISSPLFQSLIIGLITSGVLMYIFTPGRLIAFSTIYGCLLGGLFAKSRLKKNSSNP